MIMKSHQPSSVILPFKVYSVRLGGCNCCAWREGIFFQGIRWTSCFCCHEAGVEVIILWAVADFRFFPCAWTKCRFITILGCPVTIDGQSIVFTFNDKLMLFWPRYCYPKIQQNADFCSFLNSSYNSCNLYPFLHELRLKKQEFSQQL